MMTASKSKSIRSSSPGNALLKGRREKRLKRTEIAKQLHVDEKLLKAFDEWQFEELPELTEPAYVTLRQYARLVGVSPAGLERVLPEELQPPIGETKIHRRLFFASRVSYVFALSLVVLAFLGFLSWRTIRANAIPELTIFTPTQNLTTKQSKVAITGMTSEGAQVFINGSTVPVDTDGEFNGSVILQPGPNTVEIRAINSFAREHTEERVIIRQ